MSTKSLGLYDVEVRAHHGAKPGFAARGLTRDKAEEYAAEMAEVHRGSSYEVVMHDPKV